MVRREDLMLKTLKYNIYQFIVDFAENRIIACRMASYNRYSLPLFNNLILHFTTVQERFWERILKFGLLC